MRILLQKSSTLVLRSIVLSVVQLAGLNWVQAADQATQAPRITDVQVRQVEDGGTVKFQLELDGQNFGSNPADVQVRLHMKTSTTPIPAQVDSVTDTSLLVSAEAPINTQIISIDVSVVKGVTVSSNDFQINIIPTPSPTPTPPVTTFQIEFEHQVDKTFPNLHTVVATKKSGDGGFNSDPNRMHVELSPPGATNLQVVDASEKQMELHFVAASDYVPTKVLVTVFNGSDLATRQAIAIAQPAPTTAATDPNQPSISRVDIVFLQRSQGNGRVRIYGSGFGPGAGLAYDLPPYPVDDYLYYCLQREDIGSSTQYPSRKGFRRNGCAELTIEDPATKAVCKSKADPETKTDYKAKLDAKTKTDCEEYGNDFQNPDSKWIEWRNGIRKNVTVTLNPRNTDLRIERVEIIDINDSYIDVYFEFTRVHGYSLPFRLGGVTALVRKTNQVSKPPVTSGKATITVVAPTPKTYQAYQDIGKGANSNLSYRYTVLDRKTANTLLGKGIADNFYVLQIAMVNSGTKKVTVPLAAIQAEVEWARGNEEPTSDKKSGSDNASKSGNSGVSDQGEVADEITHTSYLEGPPTVTPARLAAVSAHFDAFQKSKGARAIMFNIMDGLTTFGAALVPFAGPGLQDAHTVFTGGFIPGMHKAVGDLSSQQLQNLTSLSWQDSESIAPGGGSIEKLIYIQRDAQFDSQPITVYGERKKVQKKITNLLDLDITGYEVNESTGQQAVSTSTSQSVPAAGGASSGKSQ